MSNQNLNELKAIIGEVVGDCFAQNQTIKGVPQIDIIDRAELCKRLNITEPTVIRWEKKGRIPSFRIGSSVRYNWQRVIDILEGKKKGGTNL